MLCEHVVDQTSSQHTRLKELEHDAVRVVNHLRKTFPHEPAWRLLVEGWNGKVLLGATPYKALFNAANGCLTIGVPVDGGYQPLLNARMLLALSSGASGGKVCSDIHAIIVSEASSKLGMSVSLGCDECTQHGMCDTSKCSSCTWTEDPKKCHFQRTSWPELLGTNVRDIPSRFPGRNVEYSTWDSLHFKPASADDDGVIRVTYDARTNMIVHPAPHIGTVNIPLAETNCFIKTDASSTLGCIGAPQIPPSQWSAYVGSLLPDVIDSLRMRYPHATVEATPQNARLSADKRPDRIRVFFDNAGIVTSIPRIG